jgi:fermentation-respiration switch protein FrsA (DUF1100 family)
MWFAEDVVSDDAPPALFVHGDDDGVVPISGARDVFDELSGPRAFVTLIGGGHSTEYVDGSHPHLKVMADATARFLRWVFDGDAEALADLRTDVTSDPTLRFEDDLG